MIEATEWRRKLEFRISPLLDMALSLRVLENPERFGSPGPWAQRVANRLPVNHLDRLYEHAEQVDLFALALDLELGPLRSVPDTLMDLRTAQPDLADLLLPYWEAISPEVGAMAGLLAESLRRETKQLAQSDPVAYLGHLSDRVSLASDEQALLLDWGQGMRVPLAEIEQILLVPSAFCPRRLMFYRVDATQIFFYAPLSSEAPPEVEEAPERLVLGFAALADVTRLKLLRLIATGAVPAQEMARQLSLNESTVSRHLRLLVEAGLVGRGRQEGKFVFYDLQSGRIDQVAALARTYLRREPS